MNRSQTPASDSQQNSSQRSLASRGLVRWLKFNFVGGVGIAVQLGALALFHSVLHLDYLLATALAVETAVIHNFLWHERFTWPDRPAAGRLHFSPRRCLPERSGASEARPAPPKDPYVLFVSPARLLKFNAINGAVSLAGNLLIMRALAGQMGTNYAIANLIAIAICSLINFLLSDRLVFQRRRLSSTLKLAPEKVFRGAVSPDPALPHQEAMNLVGED